MTEERSYFEFHHRAEWRGWLEANHRTARQAWLVHYKKRFPGPTIPLEAAVEEALCFGWIDGALRPQGPQTYLHKYSPRRPNSIWSVHNITRAEKLIQAGLMTPAGLEKIQEAKENGQWADALRREAVEVIPPELETVLRQHPGAVEAYQQLKASRKKQFIYWLQSAKRPETLQRRIQAILDEVLTGPQAGQGRSPYKTSDT